MGKFARHQPRGNVSRDIQRVAKRTKLEGTARSLAASTIGEGGITLNDGTDIRVKDGGSVRVDHPNGNSSVFIGRLLSSTTDDVTGRGILVETSDGRDVLAAQENADGNGQIRFGSPSDPLHATWVYSAGIVLDAEAYGSATYITHGTTSNPASCVIETNGQIRRSTSASKYKQDVEAPDLDSLADAALRLRPRKWRDRAEVAENPDTTRRYLGFIAEEVSEDGLDILVTRDAESGEAEGLAYGQISAPIVALVQRQQRQIADLTARLEALEASA
ncbi:tail fiber domain-containing protein [Phytomonospora sp. NPDC050363]|uniref:tail fiber domain-containing protein n=1 Tax=Phytomonospora sp. NPDC050363 TaxID=3155642 RepID=UPI0033D3C901